MSVDTRDVEGRRKVRYEALDEVIVDAERLAELPHRALGNWSLGQILKHLGAAMHSCVDGPGFPVKWYLRWFGRFFKGRVTNGPFPTGFRLPRSAAARLVAQDTTTVEEGLSAFKEGMARLASDPRRVPHPVVGKLTVDEWYLFHLRHAEMHMSFLVEENP
jgi:hypothetical protein